MWRRSWLSREVLLFTLFLFALTAATAGSAALQLHRALPVDVLTGLDWLTAALGIAGTLASAYIYLVPARPSWNMRHTPIDFISTGALLGSLLTALLCQLPQGSLLSARLAEPYTTHFTSWSWTLLTVGFLLVWLMNQGLRLYGLRASALFEAHAAFSLLWSEPLRTRMNMSFALVSLSVIFLALGYPLLALAAGWVGTLLARYLFFVTVVPLNMALTFVRSRSA
jgi:DMSO reductase anchor subunit